MSDAEKAMSSEAGISWTMSPRDRGGPKAELQNLIRDAFYHGVQACGVDHATGAILAGCIEGLFAFGTSDEDIQRTLRDIADDLPKMRAAVGLRRVQGRASMSDETHLYAYCFPSGEIGFGNPVPKRAIAFIKKGEPWATLDHVEAVARYEPEGVYLVPGVPEADSLRAVVEAVTRWVDQNATAWREAGLDVLTPQMPEDENV